jgi:nitroreductase
MDVYEAILKRRSIRRFEQKEIPSNILEKIADAARLAPSGANLQPCEYVIINKPEILKSVFATLKWAAYITPLGNPPEGMEPTAYIIVLVNSRIVKFDPGHDTGAAIENMILTAVEEGIGSCWLGSVNRTKLAEIIKMPGHLTIDSVVALGYPAENPVAEELKDSVKYWKDSKGRLHVPKRKLKDILRFNT